MSNVHMFKNTEKEYSCVNCGSENVSIIREGKDPRLKCNGCSFMFNGSDSDSALEAGKIPTSSAESLASADEPETITHINQGTARESSSRVVESKTASTIPRTPKYIFITKDRKDYAFATERDMKKTALVWQAEGKNYDMFKLTQTRVFVKVDVE